MTQFAIIHGTNVMIISCHIMAGNSKVTGNDVSPALFPVDLNAYVLYSEEHFPLTPMH